MVLGSRNRKRSEVPVVDLSGERSEVRKVIVKACEEYGLFKVINHGISHQVIAKTEEAGFAFFHKPVAQKKLAAPAYGCKNIGFNGDVGELEYLLFSATTHSISQISKTISTDPLNTSFGF
ncbi:Gibberellin 2-beta-dioxygenase 2, partial [Mucuna pruriens]